MRSLRIRLVLLLSFGLILVWLLAAWFTYVESRGEIDQLFDAQLSQSAQVLLETTRHELHERMEHNNNEIDVTHDYAQKLAFQIWDDTNMLMRSSIAPLSALIATSEGYSQALIDDQPWRVLSRWDEHNEFMVQVGEPLAGRESLARHITFKMLVPTFVVLPAFALLIWFGVGAGLRPLKLLKQEVKQRTASRLDPVNLNAVPEEVQPLVQALNDLFVRLELAFDAERRFTADAAHELRTPLAALKIQAQVAMRTNEESEHRLALENIVRGTDRATHLVEQLLILSRVDPEVAVQQHEQVDLGGLMSQVLVELEPQARAKQIELALHVDTKCHVSGNAVQLSVMLRNLLDNAIRYTPVNGEVDVTIRQQDGVVLEVADTGPGIPVEVRSKVLRRFYRVAGTGQDGSGLGLSIVQRIAELHGAHVELGDNPVGRGLLVSVLWPSSPDRNH